MTRGGKPKLISKLDRAVIMLHQYYCRNPSCKRCHIQAESWIATWKWRPSDVAEASDAKDRIFLPESHKGILEKAPGLGVTKKKFSVPNWAACVQKENTWWLGSEYGPDSSEDGTHS